MNKKMKVISAIIIFVMMLAIATSSFADVTPVNVKPNTAGSENITALGSKITGIIQVIGIITSVAVLIVLGIKYMMGSAEEKAEYKKTLLPYIIGAAFVFVASTLANTLYTWITTAIPGA